MRLQLIALTLLLCTDLFAAAAQEKEMQALFVKYYQVMDQQKVELIDEVFSKKFIKDNGGAEAFAKDVRDLPKSAEKSLKTPEITFNKGVMDEIYFAKVKQPVDSKDKSKTAGGHTPEFIVVVEDGKLKIQGTLSDGD